MASGIINDEYTLFFENKKLKKDIDFVIIVNEDLFSVQRGNYQKLDIIHEIFHIIKHLNVGISHYHHETEPIIIKLLNEYYKHIHP